MDCTECFRSGTLEGGIRWALKGLGGNDGMIGGGDIDPGCPGGRGCCVRQWVWWDRDIVVDICCGGVERGAEEGEIYLLYGDASWKATLLCGRNMI